MKITTMLSAALAALAIGLIPFDADAKRFGGGSSLGKQRAAPTSPTTTKEAAPAPAKPAAGTATTPPAQPGFMSRFGGLIAGLGIGALLGSLFGGSGIAGFLVMLLVAALAFVAIRAFMARRAPVSREPVQFAGAGAGAGEAAPVRGPLNIGGGVAAAAEAPRAAPVAIPGFEAEPFLRVAKTSFIRLQAANDAKDLDDIRDFTTPELFAEIAMQAGERGDAPQKTEVVTLNASLVEAVVEGDYAIASVRFTGLIREQADGNPEPFDEIWHVRQDRRDRKATWLIAGIQQVE
jgi:predicted lipid-binding transport protein (Tim44 family)